MRRRALVAVMGSLLFAVAPVLAVPPAVLVGSMSSRGVVRVNGITAPNGTNVYAGSRVVTGAGAVALVALTEGGKLALASSTSARILEHAGGLEVQLERGEVDAVSAAKTPVQVEAGGVTIHTRKKRGAFEVSLRGSSLRVVARRGPVDVATANRTVRIAEGKTLTARLTPPKKGRARKMDSLLILAGAAGAAGLALTERTLSGSSKQTCVSPNQLSCP